MEIQIFTYIYLENHKDKIFCSYRFGHLWCPLRSFSSTYCPFPTANPLLTGQGFLEILDLLDRFRQYECLVQRQYLGQYVDICLSFFFQHDFEKKHTIVLYGYIQIGEEYAYPMTNAILLHFGLKLLFWRLSEFGVVQGFEQPVRFSVRVFVNLG